MFLTQNYSPSSRWRGWIKASVYFARLCAIAILVYGFLISGGFPIE